MACSFFHKMLLHLKPQDMLWLIKQPMSFFFILLLQRKKNSLFFTLDSLNFFPILKWFKCNHPSYFCSTFQNHIQFEKVFGTEKKIQLLNWRDEMIDKKWFVEFGNMFVVSTCSCSNNFNKYFIDFFIDLFSPNSTRMLLNLQKH